MIASEHKELRDSYRMCMHVHVKVKVNVEGCPQGEEEEKHVKYCRLRFLDFPPDCLYGASYSISPACHQSRSYLNAYNQYLTPYGVYCTVLRTPCSHIPVRPCFALPYPCLLTYYSYVPSTNSLLRTNTLGMYSTRPFAGSPTQLAIVIV